MLAIPAVDLREGACVQLVGGSYDNEQVRLDDPVAAARRWEECGFKHLHIVDLDAAMGKGSNSEVIRNILSGTSMSTQIGGGVRNTESIDAHLRSGAARVIVGTRALEDPEWLEKVASMYPQSLIVSADVRERKVVTRGWTKILERNIVSVVNELNSLPLAGIMVTAVHKEGQMQGTDIPLMEDVVEESAFPVYAAGGVGTIGDLRALADCGVAATVIGMALYTDALNPYAVAEEFSGVDE